MLTKVLKRLSSEVSMRIFEPFLLTLANVCTISYPLPLSGLKCSILRLTGIKIGSPTFIDKGFQCFFPKKITISKNCSFGHYNRIWAFNPVYIGANVQTAIGVTIVSGGHRTDNFAPLEDNQETTLEGDNWIGANVTILGGTRIGRGAIIAAGAVVTGDIPPYTIAGGIPARVLKRREPAERTVSPFGTYPSYIH
ncbi:acetyltransferase-like isoleucine patch superfamily enzyme [Pontibacter ummariensis]|uniref:Acetyltransferase (Isoleucine patch superfamily) n=1 Tax=Pontibacter ummariensis TaxID=1610492 RepID=A0A239FD83_9BACT|nr:acyltransferase [Pontibacter ummariensis]PRY12314.1 acetyltransferase-like isoleucine patch superfamily enzyme [Pontibacter ummariensis]SNS54701.1 Acetyltransferase (isoleucine patch superfamily) [Pontibacter ummariensis]